MTDETTTTTPKKTLKASDVKTGRVYTTIGSARQVSGKYGGQLAMATKDEFEQTRVIYLSEKSGIAKGLASGKLSMPLRLVSQKSYGVKTEKNPSGVFYNWALAPKQ